MERLKKIFTHNKIQKLSALTVAAALWLFVMGSQDPSMNGSYNVSVSLANPSREYRVIYEDQYVKVSLNGARSKFAEYKSGDIQAFINATNLAEGEYDLPVEVAFPKGFELEKVTPDKVHVKVDPYIEKQIPAEVIVNGSTVSDSFVQNVTKSLDNITVLGAKTAVNSVDRVIGYVGLTGNKEDFEIKVPMTAIDSDGREVAGVRVVPASIMVTIDIESGLSKKTVPIISEISPPTGREIEKITVTPANIELSGKEETLAQINSVETARAVITAGKENFDGNLKIVFPAGVTSQIREVHVHAELKNKD